MKLIIAGGRTITDLEPSDICSFIEDQGLECCNITEVVSGGAKGVDMSGEDWAFMHHIPIMKFNADWDTHGKAAGPIRNGLMAEYADALLLIWDGKSKGSASMKSQMFKLKKPVYEIIQGV